MLLWPTVWSPILQRCQSDLLAAIGLRVALIHMVIGTAIPLILAVF